MTNSMTLSAAEDAELVELCLGGDRQAYRSLVERYQSLVCAVAFSGCGDLHQSEDIAQEAFVEAWRHLPELKDARRVRPWLCGIARNVIASTLRRSGRRPAVALPDDADQIVGRGPGPEQIAISAEEQAILWQHLSRLPETYRLPLVLYYRHDESMAAVADALEVSEETARQRLSRGRAMLADRIDQAIRHGLRGGARGRRSHWRSSPRSRQRPPRPTPPRSAPRRPRRVGSRPRPPPRGSRRLRSWARSPASPVATSATAPACGRRSPPKSAA